MDPRDIFDDLSRAIGSKMIGKFVVKAVNDLDELELGGFQAATLVNFVLNQVWDDIDGR